MVEYTITMDRESDEKTIGITHITFKTNEQTYALIGDILTGRLRVEPAPTETESSEKPTEPVEGSDQ